MKNILKIANHNQNCGKENEGYFKFYTKIQGISRNDEIVLELRKRKDRPIVWNVPYNTRQIIEAVFPLYFVDARQIELTDWTNLWKIGRLMLGSLHRGNLERLLQRLFWEDRCFSMVSGI